MRKRQHDRARRSDAGAGLVEIPIAMLLLGVLLVAFFPLVVNSVKFADQNHDAATANRLVSAELDVQREGQRLACTPIPSEQAIDLPAGGDVPKGMTITRTIDCETFTADAGATSELAVISVFARDDSDRVVASATIMSEVTG